MSDVTEGIFNQLRDRCYTSVHPRFLYLSFVIYVEVRGCFYCVNVEMGGILGHNRQIEAFKALRQRHFVYKIVHKVIINIVKYMWFSQVHITNLCSFFDSLTQLIKIHAGSAGICRLISHTDISRTWRGIPPKANLEMSFFSETICKKNWRQSQCAHGGASFPIDPQLAEVFFVCVFFRSGDTVMCRDYGCVVGAVINEP